MEKILEITWRHTPDQAKPCLQCSDTKKNFSELLQDLLPAFREEMISVRFRDELVDPGGQASESQVILNGIPISFLLSHAAQGEAFCHASKWMPPPHIHRHYAGPGGISCDEAPEIIFRKAIVLSFDDDIRRRFSALR